MTEWFKVLVLKTSVGQLTASSNLALSAKLKIRPSGRIFNLLVLNSNSRALRSNAYREFGEMSEVKKCLHFFTNEWRSNL